jgi:hypothetical protein
MTVLLQIQFSGFDAMSVVENFPTFRRLFIFKFKCTIKYLINPEEEDNTVLRHVKRCSVRNSVCHLRRPESSEIQFLCPHSKRGHSFLHCSFRALSIINSQHLD